MISLYYIAAEDITEVVPARIIAQITDDTSAGSGANVNHPIVLELLKASESTIDSYLSGRYALPVKASDGTVPPVIRDAVLSVAKYKLYARRNAVTPDIQAQYDGIISWLRAISSGKADMPLIEADGNFDTSRNLTLLTGETYDGLF